MNLPVSLLMLSVLPVHVSVPISDCGGLIEYSTTCNPNPNVGPFIFIYSFEASSKLLSSLTDSIESEDSSNSLGEDIYECICCFFYRAYFHHLEK